jgi:hypothetical protein
MAAWQHGSMAAWQHGSMAAWRHAARQPTQKMKPSSQPANQPTETRRKESTDYKTSKQKIHPHHRNTHT